MWKIKLDFFSSFAARANSHSVVSSTVHGLRLDKSFQNNVPPNFDTVIVNLNTKIKYLDLITYCTYKNILDLIT